MRKTVSHVLVTAAVLSSGNAHAQQNGQNGWSSLGGILQQACGAVNGNVGGTAIKTGSFGEKMQWLCQLKSIHGFINDNILNGDWESFAKDVAGQYLGQLAGRIGDGMNTGGLNELITGLNDTLHTNYASFRQSLYGAVASGIGSGKSLNGGFSADSVGGKADAAIKSNPTLALANSVARVADTMNAAAGVESAYKARKIQDEAKKALETNTAQAMSTATNVIGTPTKEGIVDKYTKDARTAVSAREVNETLVQLTGEAMKQDATMAVAVLNQLGELAQQQVMTNTQLMLERQTREKELANNEDEFRAQVEQVIAENTQETNQYRREVEAAYSGIKSVLDSKVSLEAAGD